MTPPEIAEALVIAIAKVIEAAPDENHRNALRAKMHQHLERIEKGDRGLVEDIRRLAGHKGSTAFGDRAASGHRTERALCAPGALASLDAFRLFPATEPLN